MLVALLLVFCCCTGVVQTQWFPDDIDFDICDGDCEDEGVVIPPTDKTGEEGETISFTCVAGNPGSNEVTNVQWYKEGDDSDEEMTVGITNEDLGNTQYRSYYVIYDIELYDMGTYYCKISYTDTTTVIESDRVTLYVRGIGTDPESTNPAVGDSISFTCVANGGEVTVAWYLDDSELSSSLSTLYSYIEDTQSQESVLVIDNVDSDDEGVYKCKATYTDDSTEVESGIATLVIYNIAVTPGYGILGNSVTMTCVINSNREPEQVSWTKENNVIDVSATSEFSASSKTTINKIMIDELGEDDFGSYACIAYYDSLTTVLTADNADLTQLAFTAVSSSSFVNAGDSVTLSCSVNQPEDADSATIAWLQGTEAVSGAVLETIGTTRTSTVTISSVELTDSGSYHCQASFPEVEGELETEETTLFVRGWETALSDMYLVEGDSVYMTCAAVTEEEPVLGWEILGGSYSGTNTYEDNLMTSVFLFDSPAIDISSIICRATVSGETIETSGSLKLLEVLSDSQEDLTIVRNADQEFSCVCDDYMDPAITWYKDNVLVTSGVTTSSSNNQFTSTLSLTTVDRDDRGNYFCLVVWPTSGSFVGGSLKTRSFELSITDVWEDPEDTHAIESTAVTLSCSFISGDEADSVTWKLGGTEVTEDSDNVITTTYSSVSEITSSVLTLPAITTSQFGSYSCDALFGSDTVSTSSATVTEIDYGFTSVSGTQYVEVGDDVTLTCLSQFADADKTVTWKKDDSEVSSGADTTVLTSTTEEHTYTITSASLDDTGNFICNLNQPSTSTDIDSQTIKLYVRGFSVNPDFEMVEQGDDMTLTCIVRGDTLSSLQWYKDDEAIPVLDPTKITTTILVDSTTVRSELYAYNVASGDYGEYACKATFEADSTEILSTTATLVPVSVAVSDQYAIIGESSTIVCVGVIAGGNVPTLIVMKESTALIADSSPSLITNTDDMYSTSYVISSVEDSDFTDMYSCLLEYASESISSDYAELFEIEILSISASQSVAYGDSLTLTCTSTLASSTTVTTTWLLGDSIIDSTSEGTSGSVYKASLELPEVSDDDAGSYQCSMEYENIGTIVSTATDIGIDSFKTSPEDTVMFAGNELSLSCLIKASVEIAWRKDGDLVSESDYVSTQDEGESSSVLTYSSASGSNSGQYECEATVNGQAISTDVADVMVYEFLTNPVFTKVLTGESVTLSCSVNDEPTTPTLTWLKNDVTVTGDQVVDTSSGSTQSLELRLDSTTSDDLGMYKCAADFPADDDDFDGGVLYTEEAAVMILQIDMADAASASEGETVSISATYVSDSEVDLIWYKDGTEITEGGDLTITQEWPLNLDDGIFQYIESTLVIANFETSDTGTYTASTTAVFNNDDIEVEGSGTIVDLSNLFMTAGFAEEGNSVTLYCMYDGTGTASSFAFQTKDDDDNWEVVDTGTQTSLTGDSLEAAKTLTNKDSATYGSMLVMSSLSEDDEGFYRCTMLDSLGTTTESMERSVQLLSSSIPEAKMLIETGETAQITCSFTGPYNPDVVLHVFDDDSSSFVEDTSAYWNSETKSMSLQDGLTVRTTTTVFTKVITTNAPYKCSASFYDDSYPSLDQTVLSDQIEILTASITLSTTESTLSLYEGSVFTFICQYTFETAATVTISPTADETASHDYTEDGVTSGYIAGEMGSLTVDSFTGPYNCMLDIDGYSIEKDLYLSILEIPDLPDMEALTVETEDYNWLSCEFTSDLPLVSISWFTKVDGEETYYETYRTTEGSVYTGISSRIYGSDYYDDREFHCNMTVSASSYASETSFITKRVTITLGTSRTFGVSANELYTGDELVVTCTTEEASTAKIFKYWSTTEVTSTTSTDNGIVTYTANIATTTMNDKGNYWCEIKKDNRWNVYLGYETVEIHNRCEDLVNPDSAKGELVCSAYDGSTDSICEYSCLDGYEMASEWGESISTTCLYSGYWTHTYSTGLRLTMPACSETVTPSSFKATMVVTFSGLSCVDEDAALEAVDYLESDKFSDVDMGDFTMSLVSYQNYFTEEKCKLTWEITTESEDATPEDLVEVYNAQWSALYGSKKRFTVVADDDDASASGYEIECPAGSGAGSSGYYCVQCAAGTYSSNNECLACPIGTYQDSAGQSSCETCPGSQSTLSTGATECFDTCEIQEDFYKTMDPPAGYIVLAGSSVTTTCDEGYSIGSDGSVIHACEEEKYCSRVLMTSGYEGYTNDGSTYEMTCEVNTVDDGAEMHWYKDSTLLDCDNDATCTVTEYGDTTVTSILEVTVDGDAYYSCVLAQSDGEEVQADHEHHLTALVNTISVSEDVLFVGDTYSFTCHGEQPEGVDLPPTITSYVSGKQVYDGVESDDGLDLVSEFMATSEVSLTCEFLYVQVSQTMTLTMDVSDLTLIGIVEAPSRDMSYPENEALTVKCELHNAESVSVIEVDDSGTETVIASESNSEEASAVVTKSQSVVEYFCRGNMSDGSVAETHSYEYTFASTNVITHPSDVATIGVSVSFECEVPAGSTVSFKKTDSTSVDFSDMTTQETNDAGNEVFTLTIASPTSSDQGEYYCEGSSGRSTGALLNFVTIMVDPVDHYRDEGDEAIFVCEVSGEYVAIVWSTPDGLQERDPHTEYHTTDGNTVGEYTVTASDATEGTYYCMAADLVSSNSAELYLMKVDLTIPTTVQQNEEITVTCTVYGDHEGITISNEGRMLTVETPLDAMTTKLTGEGTEYVSTYNISQAEFTDSATTFTCNAYYDNFDEVHVEEATVYLFGFTSDPDEISTFVEESVSLSGLISADPSESFRFKLMRVEDDGSDSTVLTETVSAGTTTVSVDTTFDAAGDYYYMIELLDGSRTEISDSFSVKLYGATVEDYSIPYPGSSIEDAITLTCLISSPSEATITWSQDGDSLGSENPLVHTTYEDEQLTSLLEVTDEGDYECSATVLGREISVSYEVEFLNYALSVADGNTAFDDNTAITLQSNPGNSATLTASIFSSDGTAVNISEPQHLRENRNFTSVVEWSDSTGQHSGTVYLTDLVSVAGVSLSDVDTSRLVAGETIEVTGFIATTADITVSSVQWTINSADGATINSVDLSQLDEGLSTTELSLPDSLSAGDVMEVRITVVFSVDGGTVDKSEDVTLTVNEKCSTIYDLENGVVSASGTSIYPTESVSVSCNEGYQLSGRTSYQCDMGDLWDEAPTCVEADPLCYPVAPESVIVDLIFPDLYLTCIDSYAPFSPDMDKITCTDDGWDWLTTDDAQNKFQWCGRKMTPNSKSMTAIVQYAGASQYCTTEAEQNNAYSAYQTEMNWALDGVAMTLESCSPTADGYRIMVKYSVDQFYLSEHDYIDTEDVSEEIVQSQGYRPNGRKRNTNWQFDSLTFSFDLDCPLGSPAFLDQCVECPAGYYSTGTECLPCAKGYYQYDAGKTYCLACPSGETTPGMASDTIDLCDGPCYIPSLNNGQTSPMGGSTATDGTAVTVVCGAGYDLPYDLSSTHSCTDFNDIDNVEDICEEICIASASLVSDDHVDIIANTDFVSGQSEEYSCVEGYKVDDETAEAVVLQCSQGVLSQVGECKRDGLSTGIIVLIALIVVLVLLLCCMIPLCCYFYRDRDDEEEEEYKDVEMRPQSAFSCSNHVIVAGSKTAAETQIGNSNPFKVSSFNDYIRGMAANRNDGFIREFRSISVGSDTKKIISQLSENYNKNRYGTITTYDHSRVRLLTINNDPHSDYINASYINGYVSPNAYIATQGPLQNTVNDFWRMIWEQNVSAVVMLTNLTQAGQVKSYKYWPDTEDIFGVVTVKKMSENNFGGFVVRELDITVEGKSRTVFQYHYTEWPDVGYPSEDKFLTFIYYIRHMRQDSKKPLVVHCSAGAGWTGVFLGVDLTLDRLTKEDTVDVLGCVNSMRQQRSAMVQNEPQYIYLHKLLVDCVNGSSFNMLRANRFRSNLEGAIFVNPNAAGLNDYEGGF